MRILIVNSDEIQERLTEQLFYANTSVSEFVKEQVEKYDGPFNDVLKRNIVVAQQTGLPLCQDTGMIEFFVFKGYNVVFTQPIDEILNKVVRRVYTKNPFRYSVVKDPIFERKNTFDNTPAIVHTFITNQEHVQIRFLIKGGGSENLTKLFMLNPSARIDEIIDVVVNHVKEHGAKGCPPLNVGMGIGGSSDKAVVLSKLALTREPNEQNEDARYAELEKVILNKLNQLKIGFQGLFSGITAYSVHIEHAPTHIANLPVAISFDCYLCRKGVINVEPKRIENI